MKQPSIARTRFWGSPLFVALALFVATLPYLPRAFAHAPHDLIRSLAISPAFATDKTIYGVVRGNVIKSTNNGSTWQRLVRGLDNKSDIQLLAIDPRMPNIIYLSTFGDGIYKSEDSGAIWHNASKGLASLNIGSLYVVPTSTHAVVFAADKQKSLYRTLDAGKTWVKVYDNPAAITTINGFGWDLLENRQVFIGDSVGTVSRSNDGGLTWQKIFTNPNCGTISSIGILGKPLMKGRFFIGTSKCGIFRTTNGGQTFQETSKGIDDLNISSIAMSPDFRNDATVFASSWSKAAYVSVNAGLAWKRIDSGITTDPQAKAAGFPDFRDITISENFKVDKTVFLAGFNGLFKTTNGGAQWSEITNTLPGTLIQSFAISPAYSNDKTLALTTYVDGIYKSANNGATWQSIAKNLAGRNEGVVFSPAYPKDNTLFASIGNNIVGKSTDGGQTWVGYTVPSRAGPSILAVSPAFSKDLTVFAATRFGHVNRSTTAGTSYETVYTETDFPNCGDTCLSSLAVSPNFANDRQLLVATKSGLHGSYDGGNTWVSKGTNLVFGQQIKVAFSPNYLEDKSLFIASNTGLFLSNNGLQTWQKISGGASGIDGYFEELAVSPNFKNDATLLVTVRGKGAFRSTDGGRRFHQVAIGLFNNNHSFSLWTGFPAASSSSIIFSPSYATDHTIFATSSSRLYRSQDGGSTWGKTIVSYNQLGK